MTNRLQALALLATAPMLALVTPRPGDLGTDPLAPLVEAVAVAAWACTAVLLLALGLALLERVPGVLGRTAGRLAHRVTPAPLRALVRTAVGLGVAGAVLVGPSALAAERGPAPAVSASLDWPSTTTATPPAATPPAAAAPAAPAAPVRAVSPDLERSTGAVVVHPGDSLWAITARDLGTAATDRQVAQAWPQWWSANRAVLGDDPDLIHPGTSLQHPRTPRS